jgi:hypothetical protein
LQSRWRSALAISCTDETGPAAPAQRAPRRKRRATRSGRWQCRQRLVDAVTLRTLRVALAKRRELVITTTLTILMGKLHEALRAANVPEGLAREAAEEAANGFNKLEEGLNTLRL